MVHSIVNNIRKYCSLIKFSHTIFAMPFAFIGFFLGIKSDIYIFTTEKLVLVILCMVFARSAAMAFNRYLDRRIDSLNPRTVKREIPMGVIKAKNALLFTIISSICFIVASSFINKACFYLSPVALGTILFYSYTKRFTALCHMVLGLSLSYAPIGAYLCVTGYISISSLLLGIAVLTWVSGFDIIYAMQDKDFDKSMNLKSIPAKIGLKGALRLSSILHIITSLSIILVGIIEHMHGIYYIGALVFIAMLVYQHLIVKPDDLSRVNIAFMNANGLASIFFSIFCIMDTLIF
ncbi:MAG: UbiA-like polyprenyltransferase [Solitalea-like symbiont of Tyrophagus putrescentiae]